MTNRRRLLTALAVVAGAALLVWQIRAVGPGDIARGLASVGWAGAAGILALSFGRFVARAAAWRTLLGDAVPLRRAVAAFVAGDAAGNLTPLSLLVSEPAKAAYLAGPGGTARSLAALAAETYFFGISVAVYVMLGAAAMLAAFDVDAAVRAAGTIALAAMSLALVVAGWLAWRKPAAASAVLARLPFRRLASIAARVRTFEDTLYATAGGAGVNVGTVAVAETAFHALSFVEMWLALWLISGESLPVAAFVLDTLGRVMNALFKVVPFQLGVLQVGSELVARAIGLAPGIGVALSLVRTLRVMLWAGIGIGLWGSGKGPKVQRTNGPTVRS